MPWIKALVFIVPIAFAVWIHNLATIEQILFAALLGEQGMFETIQSFLLTCCFFLAATLAYLAANRNRVGLAAFFACFALGTGVIGMEEINWGQRLLDLETPQSLKQINKQQEMNLHNVAGLHDKQGPVAIMLCAAAVLSALCRLSPRIRNKPMTPFLTVPPAAILWFLIPGAYVSFRLHAGNDTFGDHATLILTAIQEPAELLLYGGFLLVALSWLPALVRKP